jgi:hypothetical protein
MRRPGPIERHGARVVGFERGDGYFGVVLGSLFLVHCVDLLI